jgi:hypothetical protein
VINILVRMTAKADLSLREELRGRSFGNMLAHEEDYASPR